MMPPLFAFTLDCLHIETLANAADLVEMSTSLLLYLGKNVICLITSLSRYGNS